MKSRRFLLAGAIALAAATQPAEVPALPEGSVAVGSASSLVVVVQSGDVTLTPDPYLKVVQIQAYAGGRAVSAPLDVTHPSRTLRIAIAGRAAPALPFVAGNALKYEVTYPRRLPLTVRQFGGAVRVGGAASAPVEIYDAGGSITVRHPRGRVTALADAGDVSVEEARSTVETTAVRGNVAVTLADGWSGSLVRLEATSGNVHLAVPANFRAQYDVTAETGTVLNPFRSAAHAPLVFALVETGNVTISQRPPL